MKSITGEETIATAQGTVLSILFARASSIAQALPGVARSAAAALRGLPGCAEAGGPSGERSEGDRIGEEKDRR